MLTVRVAHIFMHAPIMGDGERGGGGGVGAKKGNRGGSVVRELS